jgi:hypothetical protein
MANTIGLARDRSTPLGNDGAGVRIEGAPGNTIGGPIGSGPAANPQRNVISGNADDEVVISGAGAAGNLVIGTLIGVAEDGRTGIGDAGSGVIVDRGAAGNSLSGNVISGLGGFGVALIGGARGNVVSGGVIGTVQDGSIALGNGLNGVFIRDSAGNTVGGPSEADGVLISGNGRGVSPFDDQSNVRITGAGSIGNVVASNLIGTDRSGTRSLDGQGAALDALLVDRPNDDPNLIEDPDGRLPIDNVVEFDSSLEFEARVDPRVIGVLISDAASANTIGPGNLLSGNRKGVEIRDASGNVVVGNRIGTDASGTRFNRRTTGRGGFSDPGLGGGLPLGNGTGVLLARAEGNRVEGNLVGGNLGAGVQLDEQANGNLVAENSIGSDRSGAILLANQVGVLVSGGSGNRVESNVVSGNASVGVHVINPDTVFSRLQPGRPDLGTRGPTTSGNTISGNIVGVGEDLRTSRPNLQGILINDAPGNLVQGNQVADNLQVGIQVFGPNARENAVNGNTVARNGLGVRRQGFGAFRNQVPSDRFGIAQNAFVGNRNDTGARELNEGPTIQAVRPREEGGRITRIEITFNGYIDTDVVMDRGNYRLSIGGTPIAATPIEYLEIARRVVLRLDDRTLSAADRYRLTIVGSRLQGGLRTTADGRAYFLDGNFDGATGDNFTRDFIGLEPTTPILPSGAGGRQAGASPVPGAPGVDALAASGQIIEAIPGARRRRG